MDTVATGTTRKRITRRVLATLRLVVAPSGLRAKFGDVIAPIFDEAGLLRRHVDVARTTRDLLLPRLISGDIDVDALGITIPDAAA
jgi:type I restriction enzyme S subunit